MHNSIVSRSDDLLIYSLPWLNGLLGSFVSTVKDAFKENFWLATAYDFSLVERTLTSILPALDLSNLTVRVFSHVMPSVYATHASIINAVIFWSTLIWLESIAYSKNVSELVSRTFLPVTLPFKTILVAKKTIDKSLDVLEKVGSCEYKFVKGAWRITKTLWHNTGNIFRGGGGLSA